jgi:hypothetical protein
MTVSAIEFLAETAVMLGSCSVGTSSTISKVRCLAKVPLADNHPQHPPPEQINPARAELLCVPVMHARRSGAAYLLDQSTRSLVIILIHFKSAFAWAATGTQYPLYYGVFKTFRLGEVFDSFFSFFFWNIGILEYY